MAEAQSSGELPPDILFSNILPRLPGKSLIRFKSVSKQWHSFLKTPLFQKLHLHHAIATNDDHQNNLKHLIFSTETQHKFTSSGREGLDQDGLTVGQSFPFKADSDNMKILASFSGLVCVGIYKWTDDSVIYTDLILWNPLTGDYKTLAKPDNSHKECYEQYNKRAFGLYYSSCDDDYKILCITYYSLNAYVYSLKLDAWREVDSAENLKPTVYLYPDGLWLYTDGLWPSIALNEKLYSLRYRKGSTTPSIIRFDTRTENFTEIATPSYRFNRKEIFLSFIVLRGCIHFFVIYFKDSVLDSVGYGTKSGRMWHVKVECWVMDEDANWIKKVSLPKASYTIEPLKVVSDGEQIVGSSCDSRAWKLDLTRHVIMDISWPHYSRTPEPRMYIPYRGKYIETLVSPNKYVINEVRQSP